MKQVCWGDEYAHVEIPNWMAPNIIVQNKHIGNLDTIKVEVDNPSPQSTPQVLPSFEAHTPPVTYPEEVEETLRNPNGGRTLGPSTTRGYRFEYL